MSKTAVFIDMMSIQKYIFGSNKLKENLGASFVVKNIFKELESRAKNNLSYVGGGNALLYFDSLQDAQKEMREWSCSLLQSSPGIAPIIAIDENFDETNYSESREKIIEKAKIMGNKFIPQTQLSSFGITADCSRSGLSAEVWCEKLPNDMKNKYVSSTSYTKIIAAEKSDEDLHNRFADIIGKYKFPNELDRLGGSKGDNSHIAVVHIDGNDLGEKFKEKDEESEVQKFSTGLKSAVEQAFRDALKTLIEKLPQMNANNELSLKKCNESEHKEFLPVRPILIGGDDITFVCDARIGLFLAEQFMNAFENQSICKDNDVTSCAGIAIVKTKYPFYRAYKMAEALCESAKQKRRLDGSTDSCIDFHISFGGLGGSLENIREKNYRSLDGNRLYKRPYSTKDIPKLLECMQKMSEPLPQTKIKKFREILYEGEVASKTFIEELKYRDIKLPTFSHPDEKDKGFANAETPYIDMIELMDFYPETLRKKGGYK